MGNATINSCYDKFVLERHLSTFAFASKRPQNMNIYYTMEYLPEEYGGTPVQKADRARINEFLQGNVCEGIISAMSTRISRMTRANKEQWVICFVPSTQEAQKCYQLLASGIERVTGVHATLDGILCDFSSIATAAADFQYVADHFAGKHVILIEDIMKNGSAINTAAHKLMTLGAVTVTGFAVAKSIRPAVAA